LAGFPPFAGLADSYSVADDCASVMAQEYVLTSADAQARGKYRGAGRTRDRGERGFENEMSAVGAFAKMLQAQREIGAKEKSERGKKRKGESLRDRPDYKDDYFHRGQGHALEDMCVYEYSMRVTRVEIPRWNRADELAPPYYPFAQDYALRHSHCQKWPGSSAEPPHGREIAAKKKSERGEKRKGTDLPFRPESKDGYAPTALHCPGLDAFNVMKAAQERITATKNTVHMVDGKGYRVRSTEGRCHLELVDGARPEASGHTTGRAVANQTFRFEHQSRGLIHAHLPGLLVAQRPA
jgi:hypothetical protein